MARKNVIMKWAAGAALLGAAYLMSRKSRFNLQSVIDEAEHLISGIRNRIGETEPDNSFSGNAHDGQHLAEKIRHRVEHKLAMAKK